MHLDRTLPDGEINAIWVLIQQEIMEILSLQSSTFCQFSILAILQ